MHDTAFRIGTLVMNSYTDVAKAAILEIGAQNVNGSLRASALPTTRYIGVDMEEGDGVDLIVKGGQPLPLDDDQFDLVMATSVFEHDPAFWRTFVEMCRKAKPGGFIYVSAPSNGKVHRYPQDCWRFYPDAGLALAAVARNDGVHVELVESFIAEREQDEWNDFCAVFRRGPTKGQLTTSFVHHHVPATNVLTWQSSDIINERESTEDQVILQRDREELYRERAKAEHLARTSQAEREAREAERQFLARSAAEGLVAEERAKLLREDARAQFKLAEQKIGQINEELLARDLRISELEALLDQRQEEILQTRDEAQKQIARIAGQTAHHVGELAKLKDQLGKATRELFAMTRSARDRDVVVQQKDRQLDLLQKISDVLERSSLGWHGLMPPGWRKRRVLKALRREKLFDADEYLSRYPDVQLAGFDPLVHFIRHGLVEDRDATSVSSDPQS